MNREGAETFLRLLAEAEIRGPMSPPDRVPWAGDSPAGSTCRMMMVVAQALIAVDALDPETAEDILMDFDLAAIVRPHEADQENPDFRMRAWAAAARLGPKLLKLRPVAPMPRPSWHWRSGSAPGPPTATRPDPADRFVPVGLTVPFRGDEFTGELHLISWARIASEVWFTFAWHARSAFTLRTIGDSGAGLLGELFVVIDDRDRAYDVHFVSGIGPEWTGLFRLEPAPPDDVRWLDFRAPDRTAGRVEMTPQAAPADTGSGSTGSGSTGSGSTGLVVSETDVSAGERLLIMIGEKLLTTAAGLPHDVWTMLPTLSPGPLDHQAAGLGQVIAALEAAEAIPPLSPVPGWLATLCASLYVSGHGITTPPARDLPEPWLSLLSHHQRRKPDTGLAHDGTAAVTVALPELDGITLVLLGLHNTEGNTSIQALAGGVTPDGRQGPCAVELNFPLSVWFRDSGGRWHAAIAERWRPIGDRCLFGLRLMPPLPRSATWIEVLVAGRYARVSARLPLRWRYPP